MKQRAAANHECSALTPPATYVRYGVTVITPSESSVNVRFGLEPAPLVPHQVQLAPPSRLKRYAYSQVPAAGAVKVAWYSSLSFT